MNISGSKVIWANVMTSNGWEVKLVLIEREDEEAILPWISHFCG